MSLTPNRRLVGVVLLVPLVVTLALWAFAWPAARTAPRDLPVAIAGTAPAADQLQQRFEERDGAFEVHRYASEAEARDAIEDRTVYGAVVATAKGPELLTASAGSTVVAQLLREAVTAGAPAGSEVPVTDVVAAPAADPRGAVLGSSILPLAIAGVAAGAAVTVLGLRGARAGVALLGVAVLVGLLATAVTDSWLGALTGDWWSEAGTVALIVLAIGAPVAGLAALLGTPGIGIGALLMVLLGNPFSGVTSAPELLPRPIAVIGQLLPPGAGGSALRSVAFFDGAAAGVPVLTLGVWAVLGLVAVLVGGRRRPAADTTAPASAREPALAG
ncbi:ABC transporter permease [Streptomyces drozdowiczii]|uniref:ABC transporter permease n=1 Tax=Streptomyces drozdowiczii TaxID=202862 RepID=A0ABY6PYW5_9ACTN|nr:ABC transporter permease [Streptomyces drozdowiczii]MCX0242593.1 ABC transporter permease [Streptomyces drozdowiczii]UZK57373.1 ABC transporter permease [Streptomyces drozdowiczii]